MSINSSKKGGRGEREVRDVFRAAGLPCERTPNSGGLAIKGDLTGPDGRAIPGVHVEVKRAERLTIREWLTQTYADCPAGALPLLAFRQSKRPGVAVDPLGEWNAVVPLQWVAEQIARAASESDTKET